MQDLRTLVSLAVVELTRAPGDDEGSQIVVNAGCTDTFVRAGGRVCKFRRTGGVIIWCRSSGC